MVVESSRVITIEGRVRIQRLRQPRIFASRPKRSSRGRPHGTGDLYKHVNRVPENIPSRETVSERCSSEG